MHSYLKCLGRDRVVAVSGDKDLLDIRMRGRCQFEKFKAVHSRQFEIADDDIEGLSLECLQPLFSCFSGLQKTTFVFEGNTQGISDQLIIIYK